MNTTSALSSIWYEEQETESLILKARVESIQTDFKSDFQHVIILTTNEFGRTLILDGQTQSSFLDEHMYHESLVHPAMLFFNQPRRVFIGGGGELATAREVLRHSSVEFVVMVDLDVHVVDACRQFLPEWGGDAVIQDPRLQIHYSDAYAYLRDASTLFDVIIIDVSDPIEVGPAVMLYTAEFYQLLASRLAPGGVVVTQAGPGSIYNCTECFSAIFQTMKGEFKHVLPYTIEIPSFGSDWAFVVASDKALDESNIDLRLVEAGISEKLVHYDEMSHRHMFSLCKGIRKQLAEETRIITKSNPIFY